MAKKDYIEDMLDYQRGKFYTETYHVDLKSGELPYELRQILNNQKMLHIHRCIYAAAFGLLAGVFIAAITGLLGHRPYLSLLLMLGFPVLFTMPIIIYRQVKKRRLKKARLAEREARKRKNKGIRTRKRR